MESDIKDWITTGTSPLDITLGGGIPSGRIIELFGIESVAKTTISLEFARAFCYHHKKTPHKVLWIETEVTFDRIRAKYMGVTLDNFEFYESQVLEDIFKKILDTLKAAEKDGTRYLIVFDTLAAAKCKVELQDKTKFAGGMMIKPRTINDNLARIVGPLSTTHSLLILPNQAYDGGKKGLIAKGGMGPKYFSSIRLQLDKAFNYKVAGRLR